MYGKGNGREKEEFGIIFRFFFRVIRWIVEIFIGNEI